MRRWVVTGPAGAGKSALCGFFAEWGAAVVQGDALGHEILATADVQRAILKEFGAGVLVGEEVDRSALGKIVFTDPEALCRLNRITHGPLAQLARQRLKAVEDAGNHRLAVFEAAIYFLLPPITEMDLVVTLTARESTRLDRLVSQSGLNDSDALARIEAQRFLEDGWSGADLTLSNDGSLAELEEEARKLWMRLED